MKMKDGPKGTLVWKNKTVTKNVYCDQHLSMLLRAIMEKWLRRDRLSRKIFIQQDGAKNHISENDQAFNDTLTEKGTNAKLYTQAANSPDINLLIWAFSEPSRFSMMPLQKHKEELVELVSMAYDNYHRNKTNQTWLTLQCCFNQIIMNNRDNDYNIDHTTKENLEQIGQLSDVMDVVEDTDGLFNMNDTEDKTEDETNDESDDENTTT